MYASGDDWKDWMKDFRFGTLVFIPDGELKDTVNNLRMKYDSVSAKTSMPHVTVTQPFAKAPSPKEIELILRLINDVHHFEIIVGPATTSPNKRLLWLDIAPKDKVLALRENLHDTGLFRDDLPLTKGFIPHMTISEAAREPAEVTTTIESLNAHKNRWISSFAQVSWIIPDAEFIFKEFRSFEMK